jgi:acyl carrier protein
MITNELKQVILKSLKLDDWDIQDHTTAAEIPGWDSLSHVGVILAVEQHFGIHFRNIEVLRLKNLGDLQRLVDAKVKAAKGPAT